MWGGESSNYQVRISPGIQSECDSDEHKAFVSTEVNKHRKKRKSEFHFRSSYKEVVESDGDSDNSSVSVSTVKSWHNW